MNDLVFKDMDAFMAHINRLRAQYKGRPKSHEENQSWDLPVHLKELVHAYDAIGKGCPCRRKQRAQHATIIFRNTFLSLPSKGKKDLLAFLDLPDKVSKVIVRSGKLVLTEIENPDAA